MRLAILADIHGNIHALQAVAAKLETLQPDAIIVDGDIINAVPFSNEVLDFLRAADWVAIRGNHEFYFLDYVSGRAPES
jgi:predicted phosphodiesterase